LQTALIITFVMMGAYIWIYTTTIAVRAGESSENCNDYRESGSAAETTLCETERVKAVPACSWSPKATKVAAWLTFAYIPC